MTTAMLYYLAALPYTFRAADVPHPKPQAPKELQNAFNVFLGWLVWGGIAISVAGAIICGIMMAIGRRHRSAVAVEGANGLIWVIAGIAVIALSASLVGAVLDAVGS